MGGYSVERLALLAASSFESRPRLTRRCARRAAAGGDWRRFRLAGAGGPGGLEEGAAQDGLPSQVPDADLEVVACLEQTARAASRSARSLPGAGVP